MRFSNIQLIALTTLLVGYGAIATASNLTQFIYLFCLILGSAAWLVFATLSPQKNSQKSNGKLLAPSSVLVIGFILMMIGLFVFVPAAERIAIQQYLIAERQGYQFADLEGTDGVGLSIAFLYLLIGLPISLLVGLIGAKCSNIWRKSGIGRYSLAVALMLSPLFAGAYTVFHYWFINWSASNSG